MLSSSISGDKRWPRGMPIDRLVDMAEIEKARIGVLARAMIAMPFNAPAPGS